MSRINFLGRSGSLATMRIPQTLPIFSLSLDSSLTTIPVLDSSSSGCDCHLPHSQSSSSSRSVFSSLSHSVSSSSTSALISSLSSSSSRSTSSSPSPSLSKHALSPLPEELDQLFSSLLDCSTKPAILALVRGYSSRYVPNSLSLDLPPLLSDLYKAEYLSSSYYELLQVAQATEVVVTPVNVTLACSIE